LGNGYSLHFPSREAFIKNISPMEYHNMFSMITNFVDTLLADEKPKKSEEANEHVMAEKSSGVGHSECISCHIKH